MILKPSEAEIGRDYLTAKSRIRVRFRGPKPKRNPTDATLYLLHSLETGHDLPPCGDDYLLATLDEAAPLTGGPPPLDAFGLNSVAWCRDNIPKLADADLEALAALDTRPGVQSAVATEVLRRAEGRAAELAEAERVARAELGDAFLGIRLGTPDEGTAWVVTFASSTGPLTMSGATPKGAAKTARAWLDSFRVAEDVAADDLPMGEPLAPPDDGIAAAFPEGDGHGPALGSVIRGNVTVEIRDLAHARQLHAEGAISAASLKVAEMAYTSLGDAAIEVTANPDDPPAARPTDGLEEVFGDLPPAPSEASPDRSNDETDDELLNARARATAALGADYRWLRRGLVSPWVVGVVNPASPGSVKDIAGDTPSAAIDSAREWLASMRAPGKPRIRRKRRESAGIDSAPSPDVSAVNAEIEGLKAALHSAERERDVALAKVADAGDLRGALLTKTAEVGDLQDAVTALTSDRENALTSLADRMDDLAVWKGALAKSETERARAEDDSDAWQRKCRALEAERDQLRALTAPAPMPASLSPEGVERAAKVQAGLRALADAYPWTLAAEEARATLAAAGVVL